MEALSFACDVMLGRLARWLRFAGLDTVFDPFLGDLQLAALARSQGRWLLTRDRRLAALAGPRVLLLHAAMIEGQVAELRSRLALTADPRQFLSRCSCCNARLAEVAAAAVRDRVPPYVATHANRFFSCPGCGRIYWRGSHPERIERQLVRLFGSGAATPG